MFNNWVAKKNTKPWFVVYADFWNIVWDGKSKNQLGLEDKSHSVEGQTHKANHRVNRTNCFSQGYVAVKCGNNLLYESDHYFLTEDMPFALST